VDAPPVVTALRLAASDPDTPAVIDGVSGGALSRACLAERSAAVAAGLAERGIGRGDFVAVGLPNSIHWPVVTLGIWRAGAVLVPLNPTWTAEETGRLLEGVRPRVALVAGRLASTLGRTVASVGWHAEVVPLDGAASRTPLELPLAAGADPYAAPELAPGDLGAILFSSGTSGLPKGVRRTHLNLAADASIIATGFDYDADSVVLAGAPFCHTFGLSLALYAPLSVGARIVTAPLGDAGGIVELLAERRVTHAALRPPTVANIATEGGLGSPPVSGLKLVVTGGAHVPPGVQLQAGERLGCPVRQGYGLTETGIVSGPLNGPSDPSTVGRLAPATEARLIEPDSGGDPVRGHPGELWLRGPQITDGYHGDPEATAAALTHDGWLRTGDLVTIRDDGQLVIEDRLKELIKVGGASVAPAELELVLREHPSVRDAAVVGRPHPKHGEVPVAHIVAEGRATAGELIDFVSARVAGHKRLHDVRIVDELPRSASGKLARRVLRDRERAATIASPGRTTNA
jgi:acyl-CoA synthetase (AMP-forming)/AMP-acid ligase II